MSRLGYSIPLLLILILGLLLGLLGMSLWDKKPPTVERVAWAETAQWVGPSQTSYRFYARHTFFLPGAPEVAWLRLSADNDFILYVNGQKIIRETSVLRSSRGLGDALSDTYQTFNDVAPYQTRSFPEFWLANPPDWKLTAYVDLTAFLHTGKNAIAVEIQNSEPDPRFVLQGEVYPVATGPAIDLSTGQAPWKVSSLAENLQDLFWFEPAYPDMDWPEATMIGPVVESTYSRLSPHLFDRPLQGSWMTGTESSKGEVWLRGYWQMPQTYQRAFIRFAGDGVYGLLINGLLVRRFPTSDGNQLHLYEVTNFLHPGQNTLAVRLARPITPDYWLSSKYDPLQFFLDGWAETDHTEIIAPIATDSNWESVKQPTSGWSLGQGEAQSALFLGFPNPQEFRRTYEGDAYQLNYPDFLWHTSLWSVGGIVFAISLAWSLGYFWCDRPGVGWQTLVTGAGLLWPGTLFLVGLALLKHRYAEAESGLLFVQPQSSALTLLGFVGIVVLTLLYHQWHQMRCYDYAQADPQAQVGDRPSRRCRWPGEAVFRLWSLWFALGLVSSVGLGLLIAGNAFNGILTLIGFLGLGVLIAGLFVWQTSAAHLECWTRAVLKSWPSWWYWLALVLILIVSFALRAYNLGFIDLDADENTSYDAIRGILRTGTPVTAAHIWYTRGPAYHYMVALWLKFVGESAVNARFLSTLWGIATLVLSFVFTRKITRSVGIALIVTAILAIDPWQIWYSRYIRFYPALQFTTLLCFWMFFKGFAERCHRGYQYIFFVALTFGLLNQEISVLFLPGFLIGFLWFYRPLNFSDWRIGLGSLLTLVIYAYDIIFFSIRCLTPLVALSTSTDSYLKFHLSDINQFFNLFFVGPDRASTIYSFFFFLGFIYFLIKKNKEILFLFVCIFLNLALLTLTTYQIAPRYTYALYPLFILLVFYSAFCLLKELGYLLERVARTQLPLRKIAIAALVLLLVFNLEPGRVLAAYHSAFNKLNTQAYEYVQEHQQPGDIIVSATPFPAAIIHGGLDYFLIPAFRSSVNFPFDTVYSHNGQIIERWAGGSVISNVDQMNHVLANANRVWIILDDDKLDGWIVDPEFSLYFKTLGKPVMATFGTQVRLWKREDGLLPRLPSQGRDIGTY
jgi:hypothetical protein